MIELLFDGLDFFIHGIVFGIAAYYGCKLFRKRPFGVGAIILFCLLNIIGILYELYQGVVRDWTLDLIANNLGISIGLTLARVDFYHKEKNIQHEKNVEYLRSSLMRRLRQRKKV